MDDLSLYIHIPFCAAKCNYCDFLSAPATTDVQEQYLHALFEEVKSRSGAYRNRQVQTVFIGGGTPSIIPADKIGKLVGIIKSYFNILKSAEITIEINPGTVDSEESFEIYKACGINRLSIGLQSANDEELKLLGRIHDFSQFQRTWELARNKGFDNINIDVMAALPNQTKESYMNTLKEVCRLNPEHISAYSLIIEEGTPFYSQYSYLLDDEDYEETDRQMYVLTKDMLLDNGYGRYEISNYARKGKECRHNKVYWKRKDYLGFGIGAASMINNTRFKNTDNIQKYICSDGNAEYEEIQKLSLKEQMEEFMFLGLRLTEGILKKEFRDCFDCTVDSVYGDVLRKNEKDGLLSLDGDTIKLTEKGLDLSNYVFAQFT